MRILTEDQFTALAVAIRAEITEYQMNERRGGGEKDTDGYRRARNLHASVEHHALGIGVDLVERKNMLVAILEALLLSSSDKLKLRVCQVIVNKLVEFDSVSEASIVAALKNPIGFTELTIVQPYKKGLSDGDLQTYQEKLVDYRASMVVNPKWEAAKAGVAAGISRVGSFFSRRTSGATAASLKQTASSETVEDATVVRPRTPGGTLE